MKRYLLASFMALGVFLIAGSGSADVVFDWNNVLLNAIKVDKTPPPKSSRAMAMVHCAIFDAVNAIDKSYNVYLTPINASSTASKEAAVVEAAYRVLKGLYPAQLATFDAARTASLAGIPNGAEKTEGINVGGIAGDKMLLSRVGDHSTDVVPYVPGTDPGDWQPTPPGFLPALLPNWPLVKPFGILTGSKFRGSGPPALGSAEDLATMLETQSLGKNTSATRTADQSAIALFWADGAGTVTPPGHWNQIAQDISGQFGLSLVENARLFAILNIAEADAAISCWDNKFAYNWWRPVTAIRATTADTTWSSFIVTPNFPEYSSGHSTFSGGAAQVLALYFGTDTVNFTTGSDGQPDRSYTAFSEAAAEAGRSRIYGGIHFEYSNQDAQAGGRTIARMAFENYFQEKRGFVGGSGWINSPLGAVPKTYAARGSASFSFFANLNSPLSMPIGVIQFEFKTGSVKFLGTTIDSLVSAGGRAEITGTGTVNGSGKFNFRVTLYDGDVFGDSGPDRFRIRIWNKFTGVVVYDNQNYTSDHDLLSKDGTVVTGNVSVKN